MWGFSEFLADLIGTEKNKQIFEEIFFCMKVEIN